MATSKRERDLIRTKSETPQKKREPRPRDVDSGAYDLQAAINEWSEDYNNEHDVFT